MMMWTCQLTLAPAARPGLINARLALTANDSTPGLNLDAMKAAFVPVIGEVLSEDSSTSLRPS